MREVLIAFAIIIVTCIVYDVVNGVFYSEYLDVKVKTKTGNLISTDYGSYVLECNNDIKENERYTLKIKKGHVVVDYIKIIN